MIMARDTDALIAAEWALEELEDLHALDALEAAEASAPEPSPEELERERAEAEARTAAAFEQALQEAYLQGHEDGRLEGERAEGARLRHAIVIAERALEEIRDGEMRWAGSIEENVCALAVAVARQVIGRELHGDVNTVVDLVRRALAEFPIDQPVRIRLNPQDLQTIEGCRTSGEGLDPAPGRDARWVADPRVGPGGCMVEGRERIVDGRIDTALERIYRRLTYTHV